MKKLLSLVLICAMGLGMVSCVESEESPSVEAIRNAKAEQLKALSNLYNAQAEAAKIAANAEAALLNAQAEYQKEMTKEAAEKFAVEIQVIKAQADSAILAAQKASAEYENAILAMAHAKISTLYSQYDAYAKKLATAKQDLLNAKIDLASQEAGIVTAAEAAQNTVAEETANIAQYEAELAVLAASDLANAENVNIDSLNVEKQKAFVAWQEALAAFNANEKAAKDAAWDAYDEAETLFFDEFYEVRDQYSYDYYLKDGNGDYVLDQNGDKIQRTQYYLPFKTKSYYQGNGIYKFAVIADETEIYNWKQYMASEWGDWYYGEDKLEKRKEQLAKAEANYATANKFKAEMDSALVAHDAAMVELAKAWENYDKVASLVADTVRKAAAVATAKAAHKADTAAYNALNKELTEVQGIQPKVKELTDAIENAKKAVTAAQKIQTEAGKAVADKQAAYDKITDKTTVAAAQANLALAEANAAKAKADADVKAAEAKVTVAQTAYNTFKAKYSTLLTGDAAADKAAVEAKVSELNGKIYDAKIAVLASEEALNKAINDLGEAKSKVIDPEEAAETLVSAEAAARTAHKALESLLHPEEETEYAEWLENVYFGATEFPHSYTDNIDIDPEENSVKMRSVYGLFDRNEDGEADFVADNNGNNNQGKVFDRDYGFDVIVIDTDAFDTKINDLYYKVLTAKDNLANMEGTVTNDTNADDFRAKWAKTPEVAEEELREWIEAMSEKYAEIGEMYYDAYLKALDAATEAEKVVAALEGEYDAILELLTADNSNDITEAIDDLNEKIATAKEAIAIAENVLNGSDYDSVEYQEALLAIAKENVAKLEAEVEGLTKMVEHAKAELEAAVAAHVAE